MSEKLTSIQKYYKKRTDAGESKFQVWLSNADFDSLKTLAKNDRRSMMTYASMVLERHVKDHKDE